jgi:hypothetical protein
LFDGDKLLGTRHPVAVGIANQPNQSMDRTSALLVWFQQRSTLP